MQVQTQSREFTRLEQLLPLLQCVECRSPRLSLGNSLPERWSLPSSIELHSDCLICDGCSATYPITKDAIPMMWTKELRECYRKESPSSSAISANVAIYDQISDDYGTFARQSPRLGQRMAAAARRLTGPTQPRPNSPDDERPWHLDFGCGPGHVLKWLSDFRFRQVGLDVSLTNLRNSRRVTGAMVVMGSADNMPFRDGVFDLITESAVLHHIANWKRVIRDVCRVCNDGGGIVFDSEPSIEAMAWSPIATAVFDSRWYVYKLLSYFMPSKYMFRNVKQAKLNYYVAEIHNQPGKGIDVDEVQRAFKEHGFVVEVVRGPDANWQSVATPGWKGIVLRSLSLKNPWNPKYENFGVLAHRAGR